MAYVSTLRMACVSLTLRMACVSLTLRMAYISLTLRMAHVSTFRMAYVSGVVSSLTGRGQAHPPRSKTPLCAIHLW